MITTIEFAMKRSREFPLYSLDFDTSETRVWSDHSTILDLAAVICYVECNEAGRIEDRTVFNIQENFIQGALATKCINIHTTFLTGNL